MANQLNCLFSDTEHLCITEHSLSLSEPLYKKMMRATVIDFINSHLLWFSYLISGSCYLRVRICCRSSVFTLFIIVCTCFIIFNTLCLLFCQPLSVSSSLLLLDGPSVPPSGIIKLLSNLVVFLRSNLSYAPDRDALFSVSLLLFPHLLLPPPVPSFLPVCQPVVRRQQVSVP